MTKEVIERRKALIEALRSGEFTQCRTMLTNGTAYCCLGVACIVYHRLTGDGEWSGGEFVANGQSESDFLPQVVAKFYGFDSDAGDLPCCVDGKARDMTDLNDELEWSFDQIASALENATDGLS